MKSMKYMIVGVLAGLLVSGTGAAAHTPDRVERLENRVERLQDRVQVLKSQRDEARTQAASTAQRSDQCSTTSSCKPTQYDYQPWQADNGMVYRVRFVENVGADQYRWFAGPFFTEAKAVRAARVISNASGTIDSTVQVEGSATSWQTFAE